MYKVGDIGSFCNASHYEGFLRIDNILAKNVEFTTAGMTYLDGLHKGTKGKFFIYHDTNNYWHFKIKQRKSHNHPLTKIFK
jgi:hypothetical protein